MNPRTRPPHGAALRRRTRAALPLLLLGLLPLPAPAAPASTPAVTASAPAADFIAIDTAQRAALGVRVAEVRASASASLSLPARVVVPAAAQAVVAAPSSGVLTRVAAAPGDAVRRGQLLGEMRSSEVAQLQRERDDARTRYELARRQSERDSALLREGVIAQSRAQAAAAQQRQAASLLHERELALRLLGGGAGIDGRVRLLAPIDGVVAQAHALPGQRVDAGTALFHVVRPDMLALEIDATAAQAAELRAGAAVDIEQADARGVLLAVPPALSSGQSVVLRASLSRPGSLRAGALAQARVQLPARPGLYAVPPSALTRIGGREVVLLAQPQGFRVVPVHTVSRLSDAVIVSGPLHAGESIAASGVAAIKSAAGMRP